MTDSDRAALRECPFCNEHAGVVAVKVPPGYPAFTTLHFVRCNGCGVSTQQFTSRSMAITAWNTRAPGYAAGVEIAALTPDAFRPLGFRDGVEAAAKVCDEAEAVERRAWDEFIASLNRGETQGPASSFAGLHSTMAKRIRALAPAVPEEQTALGDIAAERRRQIEAEGWTLAHDDEHDHGEMAMAAAAYAWLAGLHDESRAAQIRMQGVRADGQHATINDLWPQHWLDAWFKPKDKRRDLVRAAALIVAEIERLDRAAMAALRGE